VFKGVKHNSNEVMANTTKNDMSSEYVTESYNASFVPQNPQWPPTRRFQISQWPFEVQIALAIFCGSMTLLTVVGNLIVLYSYATTKELRTYANYFICSLAIVDLIDGSTVLPLFSIYWIVGVWPFSTQLCEAYKFINHTLPFISVLLTLVICIDRYRALTQPFKHLRQ
jgi:hypothetical protein